MLYIHLTYTSTLANTVKSAKKWFEFSPIGAENSAISPAPTGLNSNRFLANLAVLANVLV